MIYVSSSSVKSNRISESVEFLAKNEFHCIELSGGTNLYSDLEKDLLALQDQYGINYLCHNYFPPPETSFVLNLAALDDQIYDLSYKHIVKSIELSAKLGASKFGFHAGFLIDIPLNQIGKSIKKKELYDKRKAIDRFKNGVYELCNIAERNDVQLYIENNVLSELNYKNFNQTNPFLFTDFESINEVVIDGVKPLIDFAHLKVSSNVLNLNLKSEIENLICKTDYIHLSDNNGNADQNKGIEKDSDIFTLMSPSDLKNKVITLEIYDSLEVIRESYDNLQDFIK